jgi:hypothetical protein
MITDAYFHIICASVKISSNNRSLNQTLPARLVSQYAFRWYYKETILSLTYYGAQVNKHNLVELYT